LVTSAGEKRKEIREKQKPLVAEKDLHFSLFSFLLSPAER
jgi:hypothetical protein